ncbi:hypothetical protein BDV23DRAFT_151801 [Aspergillus alliaceus]|uniref:non-specific serine/threonine protein kinase n=1 Tax=Petromyces alliaceus TaxID=209559 RepID=A0A5N7CEJ4_PETAA|nr:hypothetical protein BDV23DRAFT_151801 [Aspergillus alliaceus]
MLIYEPGGYHPIMVGNVLHSRYRIADKLGYGGYSSVWLTRDSCSEQRVAVKVNIASPTPHKTKKMGMVDFRYKLLRLMNGQPLLRAYVA